MMAMLVTDPVGPGSGRYTRGLPAVKAIPRAAFGLDRATAFDMRVAPTRGDRIDSAERMPDTGIDILDAATIDRLTGSDPARAYVKAIVSAGAAFYVDEYRKVGDDWKISHTGYKRSYEEMQSRDVPGLRLTASWWATGGVSELDAG